MPAAIRSVCVFCASSEAVSDDFRSVARELGKAMAARGWELVYGGGGIGLMGEVSRAVMAAGGSVYGVIPHRLAEREVASPDITELVTVDTMRQRKATMDARADAFVVLPGGIGTLEELVEIMTLRQLGYHDRPVVVIDADGFWDPLAELFDRMIGARLAPPSVARLWQLVPDVAGALDALDHPRHAAAPTAEDVLEVVEDPDPSERGG